jgi:non-heme chloroperoxidase
MTEQINPSRRFAMVGTAVAAAATALASVATEASAAPAAGKVQKTASIVTTRDGVEIYYKDWGPKTGQPVVLSHGWPLNADSWESAAFMLANNGFRVITHDRRGHGRSSQPWDGNDMDHYADDLAQVIEALDLKNIILAGFSTGGGEVARYVGRHGTKRIAKLALVSAVPPLMLKTDTNPGGLPIEVFDGLRAGSIANRGQLYLDIASGPFYNYNRPGAKPSQGIIQAWYAQGMQGGHKNTYDSIKAFSETDFRDDLKKFDKPTLIIHGEDDQIVPIDAAGRASAKIVKHAKLITYPGAPHGLTDTHKEKFNADFLAFAKS